MSDGHSEDRHSHTAGIAEFANNSGCSNEDIKAKTEGITPSPAVGSNLKPKRIHGIKRKIIFKCYFCQMVFPKKVPLDYHLIAVHFGQGTFSCSECNLTFEKITVYNAHLGRHDESLRPFKCDHCPMRFLQRVNKERHIATLHAKESEAENNGCTKEQVQKEDAPEPKKQNKSRAREISFKCYLCETIHGNKESLGKHLETAHLAQETYVCSTCDASFVTITLFNTHLKEHDASIRPFKCRYCPLLFKQRSHKDNHESAFHKQKIAGEIHDPAAEQQTLLNKAKRKVFKCYLCEINFTCQISLDKHLETTHSDLTEYSCRECNSSSNSIVAFNQHLGRHDAITRRFKCNFCTLRFTDRYLKSSHEISFHNEPKTDDQLKCVVCDKTYNNIYKLQYHYNSNMHKRNRFLRAMKNTVMCYICNPTVRFVDETILKQHLSTEHSEQGAYKCGDCKKRFKRSEAFNRHLSRHDESIRPYKCSECTLRFGLEGPKWRHEAEVHNITNKYSEQFKSHKNRCPTCAKSFSNISKYKYHMKSAHTRLYKELIICYLCTALTRFTNDATLHKHLSEAHPKQNVYHCGECSKISKSIETFNQHLARHDAKSNLPYKCSICTLRFMKSQSRVRHEAQAHNIQNGYRESEKKYGCHACGKKFYKERRVTEHVCEATREPPPLKYECPKCTERFPTKKTLTLHRRALHSTLTQLKRLNNKATRLQSKIENTIPDTITSSFAIKTETSNAITTEEVHIVSILPAEIQKLPSSSSAISMPKKLPTLKCYLCADNPSFEVKASLEEHLTTVHPKIDTYKCEECSITLNTAIRINSHLSRHDANERPYKCSICPLRFAQEPTKLRHEVSMHDYTITSYENCCTICGKKFSNKRNLQVHMKKTHQQNAFWCYLCSNVSRFDSNDSLAEHLAVTHPEQDSYSCTECSITLQGRAVFNWHLSTHDANVRPYKCSACPERFTSRSTRKKHELDQHGIQESQSSKKYTCTICDKKFSYNGSLRVHIRIAHQQKDQLFQCYLCTDANIVENQSLLVEHLISNHLSQEEYTCQHCDFNSADLFSFNEHLSQHACKAMNPNVTDVDAHERETTKVVETKIPCEILENCQDELLDFANPPIMAESQSCAAIKTEELHIYDEHLPEELKSFGSVIQADILSQDTALTTANSASIATIKIEPNIPTMVGAGTIPTSANGPDKECSSAFSKKRSRATRYRIKQIIKCYLCNHTPQFEDKASLKIHIMEAHADQEKYECSECNRAIQNVLSYNSHLARHDASIRPAKCSICSLRYALRDSLTRHKAQAHNIKFRRKEPSKRYRCPHCGKLFAFESKLKTHTRFGKCSQQRLTKSYLRCYLCNAALQFNSLASLNDHLSTEHSKTGLHICRECDNISLTVAEYNQHLSRHDVNVRPYKCTVCPMRFLARKTKTKHEKRVHNLKSKRSTQTESSSCPTCGKEFKFKYKLKEHMRVVHDEILPVIQDLLTCYLCETNTKYDDRASFDAHISTVHPTESEYKCEECSVIINSKLVFNQHLSRHDADLRPHKCSICVLRFETHSNRVLHEYNVHSNQNKTKLTPKYDCTICEEKFIYQSSLSVHIREVHRIRKKRRAPNSNLFTCYLCSTPIKFNDRASLNSHLLVVHANQVAYTCEECNITVKTTIAINVHHSHHDPIARPYKCSICPRRFIEQEDRKRHEANVHNIGNGYRSALPSEKHSCTTCGKQFAYKCRLEKHVCLMLRPSKPVFKCYLCNGVVIPGSRSFLVRHLAAAHPALDQYTCQHCNFSSAELYEFNEHLSQHAVETTSPNMPETDTHEHEAVQSAFAIETRRVFAKDFACKYCDKRFALECSKLRHEQYMHSKRPNAIKLKKHSLKCHLCKTNIRSKQSLKQHLETVHPSQSLYQCKKCTFSTIKIYNFSNHQMLHDRSVRRYKCRFCPLRYLTAQYRKCHEHFEHANGSNQQNYACTQCDGKFSFKFQANIHEKSTSHVAHKIVKKIKSEPPETEQPYISEPIYQPAIKTEELHIYSELPQEEYSSDVEVRPSSSAALSKGVRYLLKCYICSPTQQFKEKASLDEHLDKFHPIGGYKCSKCNLRSYKVATFNYHLSRHDATIRPYKCIACPLRFTLEETKNRHQNKRHNIKEKSRQLYYCPTCGKKFSTELKMTIHMRTTHGDQLRHACATCGETYPSEKELKLHKRSAHSNETLDEIDNLPKPVLQNLQTDVASTDSVVQADILAQGMCKETVANIQPNCCYLCSVITKFEDKASLHEHLATQHQQQDTYNCDECDMKFNAASQFNQHRQRHDVIIRPFKCSICPLRFFHKKNQLSHEANVHDFENNYHIAKTKNITCPGCSRAFRYESELKRHKCKSPQENCEPVITIEPNFLDVEGNKHATYAAISVKKIFNCYLCSPIPQFKDNVSLKKHIATAHVDETKYKCGECNVIKETSVSINIHLARHDVRIRPEKCSVCPLRFTLRDSVIRHEAQVHNVKNDFLEKRRTRTNTGVGTFETKTDEQHESDTRKIIISCYLCSAIPSFDNQETLRKHLSTAHPKEKIHNCTECNESFKKVDAFNQHLSRHDANAKPYKCAVCPMRYFSRRMRREHQAFKHNIETVRKTSMTSKSFDVKNLLTCYLCGSCPFTFEDKVSFEAHLSTSHPPEDQYYCGKCNLAVRHKRAYNEHLAQHAIDAKNLEMTSEVTHEQNNVQSIVPIKVRKVVAKNFSCEICCKGFVFECSKVRHERYMHPKVECTIKLKKHSFKCYLCNTQYEREESLMKHLDTGHASRFLYQCRKCPYSTAEKQNYNNHQMLHNRSERRYKCRFCSLRYVTAQYRKCHEQFEHTNSYACANCDGVFSFKWQVKLHEKTSSHTVHKIVTKIETDSQENKLRDDEMVYQPAIKTEEVHIYSELPAEKIASPCDAFHDTQQSVDDFESLPKCYLCPAKTVLGSKKALTRHLKSMHSSQTIYQCTECEYTTKRKWDYNYHYMTHDAIWTTYECRFCLESFRTSYDMVFHKAFTHSLHPKLTIYSCSVCKEKFLTEKMLQQHEQSMQHATPKCSSKLPDEGIQSTSLEEGTTKRALPKRRIYPICRTKVLHDRYDQHMKTEHDVGYTTCAMEYDSGQALQQHEIAAHNTKEVSISLDAAYECHIYNTDTLLRNAENMHQHLVTHGSVQFTNPTVIVSESSNHADPQMQISMKTHSNSTLDVHDPVFLTKDSAIQSYNAIKHEEVLVFSEHSEVNIDSLSLRTSDVATNLFHETILEPTGIFNADQNVLDALPAVNTEQQPQNVPSTSGTFNTIGCNSNLIQEEIVYPVKSEP